jgi:hypothetical protein
MCHDGRRRTIRERKCLLYTFISSCPVPLASRVTRGGNDEAGGRRHGMTHLCGGRSRLVDREEARLIGRSRCHQKRRRHFCLRSRRGYPTC